MNLIISTCCINYAEKIGRIVEKQGLGPIQVFRRKNILGIPFKLSRGWLSFRDAGDFWSVLLTNGRHTHQPLYDDALGADFKKDDGKRKIGPLHLTGAWRSALSMWPARKDDDAIRVFNYVASMVDLAYQKCK